jgi:NADH:ubiquinone oxidoreductase subunit H
MMSTKPEPWFDPIEYGYGTGLPITWQGWTAMGLYVGVMAGAALLLDFGPSLYAPVVIMVMVLATAALLFVAKRKTRGGWRWRWGPED